MLTKPRIKAVIFDMDGVLIDSEPFWRRSTIETLRKVGLELTYDLCSRTMGLRVDEVVDYWYRHFPWQQPTKEEIAKEIVARVVELIQLEGKPKDGVTYIMDFLSNQDLLLALASSSSYEIIDAVLRRLEIRDLFPVICSALNEDYGKPHPSVYISTAKRLRVSPPDCLAIEDSFNGVLSAKAARMKCVAIPENFPDYDPRLIIADRILGSLRDVNIESFQ